jgi:hypothetical protein
MSGSNGYHALASMMISTVLLALAAISLFAWLNLEGVRFAVIGACGVLLILTLLIWWIAGIGFLVVWGIAVPSLLAGIGFGTMWGLWAGLLASLVCLVALLLVVKQLWQSLIFVQLNTLLIIRKIQSRQIIKGPARVLPPLPIFEGIFAKMPLYTMKSDFTVHDINTRELYNVEIKVHIRYKLRDHEDPYQIKWGSIMGIPNRPSVFEREKAGFQGKHMQELTFWERIYDLQVREDVDIVLRKWIYQVHNIPEVLDQVPSMQSSRRREGESMSLIRKRQSLADDARAHIQEVLNNWGLEVLQLEFLNIKLDENYVGYFQFEQHEAYTKKMQALQASDIEQKLKAQADAQAHAVRAAIGAVGEGVQDVQSRYPGTLTPEQIEAMTRAAMQEMTLILRLGHDTQARLDPTNEMSDDTTRNN